MKAILLSVFSLLVLKSSAQNVELSPAEDRWNASVTLHHDFFVDGYVRVREFQFTGDSLFFRDDLGMNQWNSAAGQLTYSFKNHSAISASCEYYFFSGRKTLDDDIWFNGTHIDGDDGISVNDSRLTKIEVTFEKPVHLFPKLQTTFIAGLLYHRLVFRVTGEMLLDSYHYEPREKFVSQALPFPQIGFWLRKDMSPKSALALRATGTCIPPFESTFYEGGDVHLFYYAANAGFSYCYSVKEFYLAPALNYCLLKTYQNSAEDTNDFFISSYGIALTAAYKF